MHSTNYSQLHTSLLTQSHKSINETAKQERKAELAYALKLLAIPLRNRSSPVLFSYQKPGTNLFINILAVIRAAN